MKRKIISLCTILASALLLSGCKGNTSRGDLKVFQPGEYID